MRWILTLAILLAGCTQQPPVVSKPGPPSLAWKPVLETQAVTDDPDDPAIWVHPTDPAMSLVLGTRNGGGKNTPKEKQQKDVTILDVFENAASVKVVASEWIDYLHMGKWNGRWVIVNVLWELKPETK